MNCGSETFTSLSCSTDPEFMHLKLIVPQEKESDNFTTVDLSDCLHVLLYRLCRLSDDKQSPQMMNIFRLLLGC